MLFVSILYKSVLDFDIRFLIHICVYRYHGMFERFNCNWANTIGSNGCNNSKVLEEHILVGLCIQNLHSLPQMLTRYRLMHENGKWT